MESWINEIINPVTTIIVAFLVRLPQLLTQRSERRGKLAEANRRLDQLQAELEELKQRVK